MTATWHFIDTLTGFGLISANLVCCRKNPDIAIYFMCLFFLPVFPVRLKR